MTQPIADIIPEIIPVIIPIINPLVINIANMAAFVCEIYMKLSMMDPIKTKINPPQTQESFH